MRMMLQWTVPAVKGNKSVSDGSMAATIEALQEKLQPEAAYYMAKDGKRAGMMVFDMTDPAQIPQIAEPLFQTYDAEVEFIPVMNADDLKRALESVA